MIEKIYRDTLESYHRSSRIKEGLQVTPLRLSTIKKVNETPEILRIVLTTSRTLAWSPTHAISNPKKQICCFSLKGMSTEVIV